MDFKSYWKEKNKKKNKFGAKRTEDGFPSGLEASVYQILRLREKAKEISDIKRQPVVVLQDGPREMKINWKIDFSFVDCASKELRYAEAKGVETESYQLKLKLYRAVGLHPLEIWKGKASAPVLVEIIVPLKYKKSGSY